MRYWMWPRRLRIKRKPPKARRLVRKRRPHRTARDRLRSFGLSRFRYLWIIPVLIAMIVVAANIRVSRTETVALAMTVVQTGSAGAEGSVSVQSAKWRTSIPAGYRLAVDIVWNGGAPNPELLVELSLGGEQDVCSQTTVVEANALAFGRTVTRAELDIPYQLSGKYPLKLRVAASDGQTVADEAVLGALTVY